jgi:molybdenum cofactor cytidylyltransferase
MADRTFAIAGVILASGMSQRMGTAKQFLPYKGMPLLEHAIRKLLPLPFAQIFAVVGKQHQARLAEIPIDDPRFRWVLNERNHEGQSAALRCAAECGKDCAGIMVFLADQPLLLPDTIRRVYDTAVEQLAKGAERFVVQPAYADVRGHPVFFARGLLASFAMLEGDEGGKRVIKQAAAHHVIPVDDAGVLFDIDTPEDYQRLLQMSAGVAKGGEGE